MWNNVKYNLPLHHYTLNNYNYQQTIDTSGDSLFFSFPLTLKVTPTTSGAVHCQFYNWITISEEAAKVFFILYVAVSHTRQKRGNFEMKLTSIF